MWVFTREGFFSVVHDRYCEPDEVMILARKAEDIERLTDALEGRVGLVLEFKHTDYRYRMAVKKITWAEYLRRSSMEIDYENYRDLIAADDKDRYEAYSKCWNSLKNWQDKGLGNRNSV